MKKLKRERKIQIFNYKNFRSLLFWKNYKLNKVFFNTMWFLRQSLVFSYQFCVVLNTSSIKFKSRKVFFFNKKQEKTFSFNSVVIRVEFSENYKFAFFHCISKLYFVNKTRFNLKYVRKQKKISFYFNIQRFVSSIFNNL